MVEEEQTTSPNYLWGIGLLYGLLLTVIGFLAANAGHGTYVLMGVFSAPLGVLGVPVAIVSPIILWFLIGLLLGKGAASSKKYFLFVILAHYSGILLLLNTEDFGDWKYFDQQLEADPSLIFLGLTIYVVGQLAMWLRFAEILYNANSSAQ